MSAPAAVAAVALRQVAAVLGTLDDRQLDDLVAGRGRLVFESGGEGTVPRAARPPARLRPPAPVGSDVAAINRLTSSTEVADYLRQHDKRLTAQVLRQIARALGPTVPITGRTKADLRRDIIEGTAGFRERTAAMSGGAWA